MRSKRLRSKRTLTDKCHRFRYFCRVRPSYLKLGYFTLEAINSFAGTFFVFYLVFLTSAEFGFSTRDNLLLVAAHGFCYIFGSWQGGRFAQRVGFLNALKVGFAGMAVGLSLGLLVPGALGQVLALIGWTFPCCLIWPSLEALVTEGEDYHGTARMVGVYNVTWSAASAVAFFCGGWLWERFGRSGLYGICIALMVVQLLFTLWLAHLAKRFGTGSKNHSTHAAKPDSQRVASSLPPQRFLQMAWLANPFAYVAVNTVGAVIPQIATKFQLSPTQSGVFCSLWFFVRSLSFLGLWLWPGWHYRFRWMLGAFIGLLAGFATMMLAVQFWLVLVAQLVFGVSVGLLYYSSLFYSMDVGEAKGEHGGLHEAAIGVGICAGPAVGAAALTFAPTVANAGSLAVSGLLSCGLAALLWVRSRK